MADRHEFCGWCGVRFESAEWPRRCDACARMTYRNPTPVAVVLQPVADGLLVVQRAIDPGRGMWALPGGFIDHGEDWRAAAAREVEEETGLEIASDAIELFAAHSTPSGAELLVFALAPPITADDLPTFVPRDEVAGIDVVLEAKELAFPLHTRVCADYFRSRG